MAGIAQSVVSVRNFSMPPRCLGVMGRLVSVNRESCWASLAGSMWTSSWVVILRMYPVLPGWLNCVASLLNFSVGIRFSPLFSDI